MNTNPIARQTLSKRFRAGMILSAFVYLAFIKTSVLLAEETIGSTVSYANGKLLLRDYFTHSKNTNWTFYNRNGHIGRGRLWMDGDYMANSIARDGWILTHIGDSSWKDYRYKVFFDNENAGGYPRNHHMVTAYFRVASESENSRQTMYRLDIWNPKDVQEGGSCQGWRRGAVGLSKYVNGVGYGLKDTCVSNTTIGTNQLGITVKGGDITVKVNGRVVLHYTDPDPIPYGGVGIGQIWETDGWYDNITVRELLPI